MKVIDVDGVGRLGIRDKTDGDVPFIMATWMRGYGHRVCERERPQAVKKYRIEADAFFAHFPTSIVCSPEREDTIHGWACGRGNFLAWAYVPVDLRGYGIGRVVMTETLGDYPGTIWVGNPRQKPVSPRFVYDEARYTEALNEARTK